VHGYGAGVVGRKTLCKISLSSIIALFLNKDVLLRSTIHYILGGSTLKKVLIIGLALAMAVGLLAACTTEDPATYKDGTFVAYSNAPETTRSPAGFDGPVRIELIFEDEQVTGVQITEYDVYGNAKNYEAYGSAAAGFTGEDLENAHVELAAAIMENNTWDVDVVAGATSTSNKVREAAQRAFEMALVEPASDNEYFDGVFMGRTEADSRGSWLVIFITIQNDEIVSVVMAETYVSNDTLGWKDYAAYGSEAAGYTGETLQAAHEALAAAMVAANSADVDAVSGSTGTSEKAVEAAQQALDAARR
jgi:uncharacterized protein with FMN-binding domain